MTATPRLESTIRRVRIVAWVFAPLICIPLSYLVGMLRAPDAPVWLPPLVGVLVTPIAGTLLASAMTTAASDLLIARIGTADERRRRLAEPPNRFAQGTSRAALALEAGDLAQATALLGALAPLARRQPLAVLLKQRTAIATGDPATQDQAIDALLAWRRGPRIGFQLEHARYHAFVLAGALAARAPDDGRVIAAARRLRADRDDEVKAYATWLASDGDPDAPDRLLRGAALARSAGRETLASSLELRAARASAGQRAPYRAG